MVDDVLKLANGQQIPCVGFGTWLIPNNIAAQTVVNAISAGYRHIDTAQAYENENGVGEGIRACGIDRKDLYITTKVLAETKDYETAKKSIDESLEKLGMDYVDLLLIHCPQPWDDFRTGKRYFEENKQVWKALEEAYQAGKALTIGVSNFLIDDLENIMSDCRIKPMVNQISTHIGMTPVEVIDFCHSNGIVTEAYSPIGHGEALRDERVLAMAQKYQVSAAQLCIRYTLQLGMVSLPKAVNPVHMRSNTELDFTISASDMEYLKNL